MYGFSNPRFFGQLAVVILPLLLVAPLLGVERRLVRGALLTAAMAWFALNIEAGGRAPIAAVPVAGVVVLALVRRAAIPWLRIATVGMAGGASLWFAIVQIASILRGGGVTLTPAVQEAVDRGAFDETYRPVFWREAWDMVLSRPLLGVGPEHFAYYREEALAAHPHNAPLQLAAEWGVLAALLIGGTAAWGLVSLSNRIRSEPAFDADRAALLTALLASIVAAALLSLFDGVIVMPVSQVALALVAGWATGVHTTRPSQSEGQATEKRPPRVSATFPAAAVSLAASCALVWTASPYLVQPRAELNERIDQATESQEVLLPRFWTDGRMIEH
jgi:putative inorganic carbon (hco3(-)) transporter